MDIEQEPMPSANVAPLLECGFDGPQCLIAEQWAQDYAKTYTRTKLDKLAQRIDQRGWDEEAEVMRVAARDTDQTLTLLAMLHGRVCHMMAHLGMAGEIDTQHATVEKLGDALDDVNEFVASVLKHEGPSVADMPKGGIAAPPAPYRPGELLTITPQSMRHAVAQCEIELCGDWCETCPTVDACRIRGACSPFLGKPRAP